MNPNLSPEFELLARVLVIGISATALLDLWAILLKRLFNIPSANWAMVGRWIGHFPRGRFAHQSITAANPIPGELGIGWAAHYLIGVLFAALLLTIMGLDWARAPTPMPALLVGIATVAAPFFIMQPGMGAGIAASKTPNPNQARRRSLLAHTVFGIGLYLGSLLAAWVL